jgi:hypothetical protein
LLFPSRSVFDDALAGLVRRFALLLNLFPVASSARLWLAKKKELLLISSL